MEKQTKDIKVSVSVLCYKHSKYLRQCLDSILNQKVNFRYEVVIGDDCSNDGSAEIIMEYKEKHPNIIVPLINEKNMGASKNSWNIKIHCQGEYIALCEGDDFWVDDCKLQKQVDFLDSHPEYSAVATNSLLVDAEGLNPRVSLLPSQVNKTYYLRDYLRYGMVLHGNTMMYRSSNIVYDEKYEKLRFAEPTMGDVITRVLQYTNGPIYALSDITHAHRSGIKDSTSFSAQQRRKLLYYTKMYFRIVDNITNYLEGTYNLEALKSNRLATVLFSVFINGTKVDKAEFREVFSMVAPKYRVLACFKFIRKTFQRITHKIARKIK